MKQTLRETLEKVPIPPLRECGEVLEDKIYRLKTFFHRLSQIEPTSSADETLLMINTILVEVEDCHSGVKAEEDPGLNYTGRMYPIEDDYIEKKDNGSILAITKGNRIIIEPKGQFSILDKKANELILERKW